MLLFLTTAHLILAFSRQILPKINLDPIFSKILGEVILELLEFMQVERSKVGICALAKGTLVLVIP